MGGKNMTQYFENKPTSKSNPKETIATIKGKTIKLTTDNGVFSKKGLDFGTRTLLENLPLEKINGKVLDFGCGYGPIGIFIAKETNSQVDMIDINQRSLKLAKKNAELNKVTVNIFESNIYSNVKEKYDYIITNPPIRVGNKILYEILYGAKKHLTEEGELWCVINKDQGAKTIVKNLEKEYLVEIVDKNKGFFIIKTRNR